MFWMLLQALEAHALGRGEPSDDQRLHELVIKRWPIAPCFLVRQWSESPFHEFVRAVQRLAMHIAARNLGLAGTIPIPTEDLPISCRHYQGDQGVITFLADAIDILLSLVSPKPQNPLTDWDHFQSLGPQRSESDGAASIQATVVPALMDLVRFLIKIVTETGRVRNVGGSDDFDAQSASSASGGAQAPVGGAGTVLSGASSRNSGTTFGKASIATGIAAPSTSTGKSSVCLLYPRVVGV